MALVGTVSVTLAGGALTFAAATAPASSGHDSFVPDENTILLIKNGTGSSITGTITTPYAPLGLALADLVVTVAGNATVPVGPFAPPYWANAAGQADIVWSLETSVTFLPIRF
jgi:hypothetical protein